MRKLHGCHGLILYSGYSSHRARDLFLSVLYIASNQFRLLSDLCLVVCYLFCIDYIYCV